MQFKTLLLAGALGAFAAAGATAASAATYLFSFAGNGSQNVVSGTLTTDSSSGFPGAYDITNVTGTVAGPAWSQTGAIVFTPQAPMMGNVASLSPSGAFYYDDLLYTGVPRIDNYGILFQVGGDEFNIFSQTPYFTPGGYSAYEYSNGSYEIVNGDFAATLVGGSVPEPATWGLMLAGFGLAGASMRISRKRAAVSA